MKNLILLLTLTLSLTAMGVESIASSPSDDLSNRISAVKKGTHDNMTGTSQKNGYRFGFKDGGDLHLWGFSQLYAYPFSNSAKITMPYFRFYFDGKKDSEWSYRLRAGYSSYYISGLEEAAEGREATLSNEKHLYFGRAFLTYRPKALKKWNFRIGRILNQQQRYDVFGTGAFYYNRTRGPLAVDSTHTNMVGYDVSEGVQAEYSSGDFSAKGAITYSGSNENNEERFFYSARVGNSISLGKSFGKLTYGLAGNITSHDETSSDGYELIPDLMWSIGNWYVMNEAFFRDVYDSHGKFKTSDYEFLLRNYFEIGTSYTVFKQSVAADIYIDTAYYDGDATSNIGVESSIQLPASTRISGALTYSNIFNEYGANEGEDSDPFRRISGSLSFTKYF